MLHVIQVNFINHRNKGTAAVAYFVHKDLEKARHKHSQWSDRSRHITVTDYQEYQATRDDLEGIAYG